MIDIEEGLFYFKRPDKTPASIMYQFGSDRIWHHKTNNVSFTNAQKVTFRHNSKQKLAEKDLLTWE